MKINTFITPWQIVASEHSAIAGAKITMMVGTLSIDDSIGERSTASFVVKTDLSTHFQQGEPVEIWEAEELIYAGVIDKPTESRPPGASFLLHSISCKDWHYLADKRIVAKAYESTLAGDIVQDLITEKLAAEGIAAGTVQGGAMVEEAVFNYVPVTAALDSIAEKTGFIWYIDVAKQLHFIKRSTNLAPWTVTNADVRPDTKLEHGNSQYRNTQYIKGGTDITDPQTEQFKGDGKLTAFLTAFKVAKVPTVEVNGVTKTVGIRGVDSGKEWYWAKGENTISQENGATPLAASDVLSVTYQGEFSIVVISRDEAEITTRQALELNSGINEDVQDEPQTTTREAAFQSAAAKLEKYSIIGRKLTFRTRRSGLKAGQLVTIDMDDHGLNDAEMLIESVNISDDESGILWHEVSAVEGPEQGSWTRMFHAMATRGQAFVIRENISETEILVTLQSFSESIAWTEDVVETVYACPIPSVNLFPSSSLFPC